MKPHIKPLLSLITASLMVSACSNPIDEFTNNVLTGGRHHAMTPRMWYLKNLPEGDDSYSQGFRDGCNTQLGTMAVGLLRSHQFSIDLNRGIEDADYYHGSRMGQSYCTQYSDQDPF